MQLREYWKRRIGLAARGTVEFANDWQWIFGVPALAAFAAAYLSKPEDGVIIAHHPIWDSFLVALLAFIITWAIVFFWRLMVVAPYQMYATMAASLVEKQNEIQTLVDGYAYSMNLREVGTPIVYGSPDRAYQPRLYLTNTYTRPLKFKVTKFDVWFDGKAAVDPKFDSRGGVIPASKEIVFGGPVFGSSIVQPAARHEIFLEIEIEYGHPDIPPTRKWAVRIRVDVIANPVSAPWLYLVDDPETPIQRS